MIKVYNVNIELDINDGKEPLTISKYCVLKEESEVEDITSYFSWENFEKIENDPVLLPLFFVRKSKKGRIIYFKERWDSYPRKTIKEWKTDINFKVTITNTETKNFSIEDILNYPDGEIAIKYLIQQGVYIERMH